MHTLRFGKLALKGGDTCTDVCMGGLGLGSIDTTRSFVRSSEAVQCRPIWLVSYIIHHTSYIIHRYPVSRAQDGRKA